MSAHAAARADRLATRLAARGWGTGPGVLLIDGRAGSGKTTLARRLAHRLEASVVHLDALYPGWDGLAEGALAVERDVLGRGEYRRYDWSCGALAEWVPVELSGPLVIEGCGAITAGALAAAREIGPAIAVWVECAEPERRTRALERDGELFRPHWDRWATQETSHLAAHTPIALAHEIVHTGSSGVDDRSPAAQVD